MMRTKCVLNVSTVEVVDSTATQPTTDVTICEGRNAGATFSRLRLKKDAQKINSRVALCEGEIPAKI